MIKYPLTCAICKRTKNSTSTSTFSREFHLLVNFNSNSLSSKVSKELVQQTMLGSTLFAMESHKHPAELRNMVTSPGGTSAAAIYEMEKGTLRTVLSKAVYAAYQRAVELGKKK